MSQICACVKIGLAPDVPAMETITDELAESPLNALRKTLRISFIGTDVPDPSGRCMLSRKGSPRAPCRMGPRR